MIDLSVFLSGQVGMALSLVLLAVLAVREVARVSTEPRWQALARTLTVAAAPIMIVFLITVTILMVEAFR